MMYWQMTELLSRTLKKTCLMDRFYRNCLVNKNDYR